MNSSRPRLAALLGSLMTERGVSLDQLARASGVHRSTIYRWRDGRVKKAYGLAGILKIARALDLNRVATNQLLQAAGQPALERLERAGDASTEIKQLVGRWQRARAGNLPAELTDFIGRDEEQFAIAGLLRRPGTRLVTLTGPGGCGKTRLARQVAADLQHVFAGGVIYIPLDDIDDPRQVLPAIARQAGLREIPGVDAAAQLASYFANRACLLLLDNFEHLLDAATDISSLLQRAPGTVVLATSRIRLRLTGEHVFQVAPFAVPDATATLSELRKCPVIDLFMSRALAADPSAQVEGRALRSVREICERLDGIPLAIELAAARCGQFPVGELLARFPSALSLAAEGPRDVADRQRTLEATIAWSYGLLDASERRLLARLSVFNGSWSSQAAAQVCRLGADDVAAESIERGIERLATASLLQQQEQSGRYRMLETIREYAGERLLESAEDELLRQRHAAHYRGLVEDLDLVYVPGLRLVGELARVDLEYDNLRPALDWARDNDGDALGRMAAALWPYWHEFGLFREGREWIAIVLEDQAALSDRVRANVLTGELMLAYSLAEYGAAKEAGAAALELWRKRKDDYGEALTLLYLGQTCFVTGKPHEAGAALVASLNLWQRLAHAPGIAPCFNELAVVLAAIGDSEQALEALRSAQVIYEREGLREGLARCLVDQGLTLALSGDLEAALPLLGRGLEIGREVRSGPTISSGLFYLGASLCFLDRPEEGRPLLLESLRMRFDSHDYYGAAYSLLGVAVLVAREGDPRRSALLFGAATARLQSSDIVMNPGLHAIYNSEIDELRGALGADFDAAFGEGLQLRFEHIVGELLD